MGDTHNRLLNALVGKSVVVRIEPTCWESMHYSGDSERLVKAGARHGERRAGIFVRKD